MTYVFEFSDVLAAWPRLLSGLKYTAELSAAGIVFGFVLGTLSAIVRHQKLPVLNGIVSVYVEAIRNTPFLVQAFLVFFGLSTLGIRLSAEFCAALALTLNAGAYTCEIMRAGLDATHKGQIEAAESLGMGWPAIYWHVMLLPAIEKVYPALTSQFVLLMLSTSITSQISAEELTGVANIVQSETFRSFEVYLLVGAIYLALSFVFRMIFWVVGKLCFTSTRVLGPSS
ncbi:Amino acid ABC transporter, permease protein, 3-TM region, His/Glu/Gln/Arg/opine [Rhodoferax ferrireducens T118]|uniref:Amino acid ABC transporter, permease protein, 3-TM region, His/Glu/Gln/Arg/opine n=1 Tax=Albidiferax ferrireducens (strain ATCC BAA-621 / DSM 15236 / T118) TaxID=338969 RepID=Q21ZM9_ALBFT|nr:amino acid ABC transporter permease [Rhodoferax ferrireducens]ABD68774.1 Amino acid ABC transporter, permease protein, 3-TM region, His/Glu/Gln/Arg/opine [Rhodoferax ferrireducens T118]